MGSHLATMLSGNGHDITVIDRDAKALEEVGTLADIITVEGDSTTFEALRKASTRKCDLFIAVNHTENDNIVAAVIAKQLGARKTIARIDNNEYLEPNNKEIFIEMGIDYLFYPEKVAAAEVVDLLGHIPKVGDSFSYENLAITITKASLKCVLEIKVVQSEETTVDS